MSVCGRILAVAALARSLLAGHPRAEFIYTKFDGPVPNVNGTLVSGINDNASPAAAVPDPYPLVLLGSGMLAVLSPARWSRPPSAIA